MGVFDAMLPPSRWTDCTSQRRGFFDLLHNQYYTYLMETVEWQWAVEAAENNDKL